MLPGFVSKSKNPSVKLRPPPKILESFLEKMETVANSRPVPDSASTICPFNLMPGRSPPEPR